MIHMRSELMSEKDERPVGRKEHKQEEKALKQKRLSKALKENLMKRKVQQKERRHIQGVS